MGQLHITRPFGVEGANASMKLVMGEGWEWSVREFEAGEWVEVACGTARSSSSALLAIADTFVDLAHAAGL